ncbi:DUF917 domain-containing protein [Pseudonocardia bannensis]|uniref:DUF917 domain-containing protein n=1 Tax=Pseudonocardia bannensis TaxID=630973 RepID=A0A848DIN4_9PSEU|nr:DUF917 domain-containing protein [Pseudonocardia bannensis]NMH92557.1 DUF917 domain-containing protein [Pseudonocardia bannensis]
MRLVDERQLTDIALGAGILGTGGGGDPYIGTLLARDAIREHGPVEVVDLDEVPDDAFVIPSAMMGAPTVMVEKLPSGDEVVAAFRKLERHLGQKATHTMPIEIGGLNSVIPFCLAARERLPVIDADLMGRAFPELQMCMPTLFGGKAAPMAIADDKGNASIIDAIDNRWTERLARSQTIDMGCAALIGLYPLAAARLRDCTIPNTLRMAEELGRLVRETREAHGDPAAVVPKYLGGVQLFKGKVVDVHRRTEGGFARAEVRIEGLHDDAGTTLRLQTQNEHLVAERDGEVLASVPDLIIVLDSETGQPITTEDLRYGFRVTVVAAPCDPRWRTEAGLEVVGPRYFGYDFDFVPIEERAKVG